MVNESAPAEVSPGIWLIRLPLPFPVATVNCYLIRGREGYLLLDCGLKTRACREALAAALSSLGVAWSDIRQLVLSHIHPDHFGLAAEIQKVSGAEVLMHADEARGMTPDYFDHDFFLRHSAWLAENGVPPDESDQIAQASEGIAEFVEIVKADRTLADGDRLPVAGGELETLWVPGHSPGLLTFYFSARRLYFSTDHIIEKITPNIGLHSRSSENPLGDYLASLDRLRRLEIDCILPSHGPPFHRHREWIAATEEHHRARLERMLAAVDGAARTAYEVVLVEWGAHLSPLSERFAVSETLAHLEYLRRQGRVEARRENNLVQWRKTS